MALDDAKALVLARDAYTASTTYFDSSIRTQIEGAIRQFRGEHPIGSKYRSEIYASRSKLFRPKTRSMVTRGESTAAEAFFATDEVASLLAWDEDDPRQLASRDIHKALLQYRMRAKHPKRCIPWYMIAIAAYQEAMVNGVVCSRQWWEWDPRRKFDRPRVDLIPIENVRYDPATNWADPVNSSPYWIELVPMYVKDVRAKGADENVAKRWLPLTDGEMMAAVSQRWDSTRQTREGPQRVDPQTESSTAISEYTIVWAHRNIVEWNGQDYFYYTLGTERLLSRVLPLEEEYWHGRRPYVMGYSAIEAHRNYPTSPVMQTRDLQAEANEVANLRLDNVKFVLSKRYFVKRNAQVDLRSLTRNTIGSATLMKDPEKDVKAIDFNDVTASSYQEQDRINADFDELGGMFSNSSVNTNRKLNETVGGMQIATADASQIGNYRLRTFVETWVEPVLDQVVLLEQKYETDEVVMALAGKKAQMFIRHGQGQAVDAFLDEDLVVAVNVGFGPTNPAMQLERFMQALRLFKEILEDAVLTKAGIDTEEVKKEIFGKLGYRDGRRFFIESDNPEVVALQQEVADLQQQLAAKESPEERQAKVAKTNAEAAKIAAETDKLRLEVNAMAQGENPQVTALNDQLATAQADWQKKEADFARERDALELRLADKSDAADSQSRSAADQRTAETQRHKTETDAKVRIAQIERERSAELAKFEKQIADLAALVKELTQQVADQGKAAEKRDKEEEAEKKKEVKGESAHAAPTVLVLDSGAGGAREVTLTEGKDGTFKGTIKPAGR